MWQALFGKKTPENEHSIQVRFAPGWNAAFIEQRSMQMPSKWTSDTEEWFNVSSMAWHGIIRTIEETLAKPGNPKKKSDQIWAIWKKCCNSPGAKHILIWPFVSF